MKRRIFVIGLALCLLLIVGAGTLAYFQSSKNLTNYFSVAGYDPENPDEPVDPDALFSLKLDEKNIAGDGRTETGNTYTEILPGDTLVKDPTITNTGKYDAWVRMKVTVTDAADWQNVCEKHNITDLASIFNGYVDADWHRNVAEDKFDTANNTITYTYYLKKTLAPEKTATLFKSITIPAIFDIDDMSALSSFDLKIVGEAIQARNTGDSAVEAFKNWK